MPPKLEDKVSPQELLDAMRTGVLKSALAKKYRASDEDFALMLYPMYRRGELTKQEFNDFFNLVPITAGQDAPSSNSSGQTATSRQEPADPADIVRTITANLDLPPELRDGPIEEVILDEEATFEELPDITASQRSEPGISEEEALMVIAKDPQSTTTIRKAQKMPEQPVAGPTQKRALSLVQAVPEKAPPTPTDDSSVLPRDVATSRGEIRKQATVGPPAPPASEKPKELQTVAKPEELAAPNTPKPTPQPVPKAVPQRQPEQNRIQPGKEARTVKQQDSPAQAARPPEVAKLKGILEAIMARLNSIDERLAKIEKKLPE